MITCILRKWAVIALLDLIQLLMVPIRLETKLMKILISLDTLTQLKVTPLVHLCHLKTIMSLSMMSQLGSQPRLCQKILMEELGKSILKGMAQVFPKVSPQLKLEETHSTRPKSLYQQAMVLQPQHQ